MAPSACSPGSAANDSAESRQPMVWARGKTWLSHSQSFQNLRCASLSVLCFLRFESVEVGDCCPGDRGRSEGEAGWKHLSAGAVCRSTGRQGAGAKTGITRMRLQMMTWIWVRRWGRMESPPPPPPLRLPLQMACGLTTAQAPVLQACPSPPSCSSSS